MQLPESLGELTELQSLDLNFNQLTILPEGLAQLTQFQHLDLSNNQLTELPESLLALKNLYRLELEGYPLNPELAAAAEEGLEAIKRYLRAQAEAHVALNEAKLILVGEGEGEVGKSCLLAALRGDPWDGNRSTTHGIEIKPLGVVDQASGQEITVPPAMNGSPLLPSCSTPPRPSQRPALI
jgi:Leucine-rich repeat (LRR) protein